MSKNKNNNFKQYKHYIREQQRMIEGLENINERLFKLVDELRMRELEQFADVISCVFEQYMADVVDEEQAGKLMLALTFAMRFSEE